VVGNDHPQLNEALTIRLVSLNVQDVDDTIIDLEVDFDNVRLDASPLAAADFDADGDVDGADLIFWQNAYGVDSSADADGDGDSDGADFLIWQRQFTGDTGELAAVNAVPEPAGIAFLTAFIMHALLSCRRTKRHHFFPG
jgi:hypothetical protein